MGINDIKIDFERDSNVLPYVDWVSIRMGQLDPKSVQNDIEKYDLTVDEVKLMHDVDLDCHLNKYGVNYLIDKHERQLEMEQEELFQNGGLSDDELRLRFEEAMYGHVSTNNGSSYDLDY